MYNICVFAGTTEGRELVEFLQDQDTKVTACVATEYGGTLLEPGENLTVSAKRLPVDEIIAMLNEQKFNMVIDATHPYATSITESINHACSETGTKYLRLLRGSSEVDEDVVYVESIEAAVEFLNKTIGHILLTTGSKELSKYKGIDNFEDRIYARVLPMDSSLESCKEAGVLPSHIIAMQGPFSEELNIALLNATSAKWMVSKDGGDAGGFDAKVKAAKAVGARLLLIGRPKQREGISFFETVDLLCERFGFVWRPSVDIVGIGPGNEDLLTGEVKKSIGSAKCLIGAKRMIEAAAGPDQALFDAIAPDAIAEAIFSHREYKKFTVVMSGDSGFYSGTKKLLPLLKDCKVNVKPGISSFVYLCSRIGKAYQDTHFASLHGREQNIIKDVKENESVFTLLAGDDGVNRLCRMLTDAGLGDVMVYVGERLSYPTEKISSGKAKDLIDGTFDKLSVAFIENPSPDGIVTCGLPDEAFTRSGENEKVVPMTKSEVRSVCMSKLQLTKRAICIDVGAGTGSCSIEMALKADLGKVYAVEKNENALALLQTNKEKFGVQNLEIIGGLAPEALKDIEAPTHVFIGGSSGNMKEIIEVILAKNPHARIVATAIALESIAEIAACMKQFNFTEKEVVAMNISKNRKAGPYNLMTAQNPIYIYTMQNNGGDV